ncbi:MAG: rRNA maturation RNase YbeY [Anaeromyxobacter sp.]|nr:rRNA maturation RNase YbeY [Anaeromyxobacter sp.]
MPRHAAPPAPGPDRAGQAVSVDARSRHPDGAAAARRLARTARRYLAALGRHPAELSVLVVTDGMIRGLNRRWRGKDRATDVLSFPLTEPPGSGTHLGDVVVSLDTATRRARGERRSLAAELDRYLAHGLLHLLGHDHERPADAGRMAAAEAALVGGEGLVGAARMVGRSGWIPTRTSTSTRSRSGSTARGTRARRWPAASSR